MQNTNSDRFTSLKKKQGPNSIRMNKFSSSGIGNFPTGNATRASPHNGNNLPPFSPTPTASQNVKARINQLQ